jgi:outer membrane biosynthesis protein TonB
MEFEHAAIALLASMVLVLAGLVGWLYWQQTRLAQNMNNIVMVVGELATARAVPDAEAEVQPEAEAPVDQEEDDRVSVDQEAPTEPIVVSGPPTDTDGLEDKTKKELQDILTKKGIPFGKGDNKNALISLLKATA